MAAVVERMLRHISKTQRCFTQNVQRQDSRLNLGVPDCMPSGSAAGEAIHAWGLYGWMELATSGAPETGDVAVLTCW